MSFLSIAFLTALPLALAPVVLHLFDRRRNVVIEWGAMRFLEESVTRRTSARRLKQWLLLLLRTLALAALVFALARPLLPGNWFSGSDRTETILILDNSMSMSRTVDEERLWTTAVMRARQELDPLPAGDFVRVLASSPYPTWVTAGSLRADSRAKELLHDQLEKLQPTLGSSDLLASLFSAVQAETQPTQRSRRIVVLTDEQATDWNLDEQESWQRLQHAIAAAPVPTSVDIVTLTSDQERNGNVAVNAIDANRSTVGVDRPITLTAVLQNYDEQGSSPTTATWMVDGEAIQESQVPDLDAQASHTVEWEHSFSQPGAYVVSCRIAAEGVLSEDDEASVIIEVVEEVPVLLVEGSPSGAELQRDTFFVETALGWIDGARGSASTVYAPTVVEPDRIETLNLQQFHAVVVPNLTELSEASVELLEEFVTAGGGLWIALGPRTDVDAFNLRLFADGNGLAPLRLDTIVESPVIQEPDQQTKQQTKINPFMKGHPATAALADTDQLDLADVSVSRRFRFSSPPQGEEVALLLSLTNGEPLAAENQFGEGRVVVQAIPLKLQWSELARSQSFVVVVQEWLNYLTQPLATQHNLSPGEQLAVRVDNSHAESAILHTPQGDEVELTAEKTQAGLLFRTSRTTSPGIYRLDLTGTEQRLPFNVNRDPVESQLVSLDKAEREFVRERTAVPPPSEQAEAAVPVGSEPLWPFLLISLIALIAGELLLSGLISRERFGSDPIAETTQQIESEFPRATMSIPTRHSGAIESPAPRKEIANSSLN